jgi:L-alanine-DL-glutamate epimerase-like enolase superfamily enzyme
VACWDILGHALGVPVYMLLGGMQTPDLHIYGSTPPDLGPERHEKIAGNRFMRAPDLPGLGTRPKREMLGAPLVIFDTPIV